MTILVNGVFKGGGAKGIGYAGALQAVEERGMWFGAVAGTSAGAITASLIAAGYTADEIRDNVPRLLTTITRGTVKMVLGLQDGLYDNRKLGAALEEMLSKKAGNEPGTPVTFRDLYRSQITLYVVALDLATSSPIVFSVHTTPNLSVTSAVLASSAIPGAFPSARAVRRIDGDGFVSHRLVDGGAWANFPRFVFQDASFQEWIRTVKTASPAEQSSAELKAERARRTLYFALGVPKTTAPFRPDWIEHTHSGPASFDKGTLQSAGNPVLWAFGSTLSNAITRLLILAALAGIVVAFLYGVRREFRTLWTLLSDDGTGLSPLPLALGATATMLSALCVGLLFLAMIAFSKAIGTTLLPSAKSALAVGTGVAPWVGAGRRDYLIMVPYDGLTTTGFNATPDVIEAAVLNGRTACADQLTEYFDVPLTGPATPPAPTTPVQPPPSTAPGFRVALLSSGLLAASAYLIAQGILAQNVEWVSCAGLAVGVGWVIIAGRITAKFHSRVSYGACYPKVTGPGGRRLTWSTMIAGLLIIVLGVVGAVWAQQYYKGSRETVTITKADTATDLAAGSSVMLYTYVPDRPNNFSGIKEFRFATTARFAVGDRIHLAVGSLDHRVQLDANDDLILLPLKAVQLFGLFLLIFGYWMSQVRKRQNRLAACVASASPEVAPAAAQPAADDSVTATV
ncbi:patatin-like phospholipase family protein [Actinocrispum sp. NPDC049592]|uniref:patatin-like phospholipase family protein n=1 Tax=Actinocrispum sp. NPDC049592 TaxID=3154835 RepID=UPI0034149405